AASARTTSSMTSAGLLRLAEVDWSNCSPRSRIFPATSPVAISNACAIRRTTSASPARWSTGCSRSRMRGRRASRVDVRSGRRQFRPTDLRREEQPAKRVANLHAGTSPGPPGTDFEIKRDQFSQLKRLVGRRKLAAAIVVLRMRLTDDVEEVALHS